MRPVLNSALKLAIFDSRKKQKRIAKLAGITETQLSHVVRGRRKVTARQAARLAGVLGKPIEELFPEDVQVTTESGVGRRDSTSKQLLAQSPDGATRAVS